MNMQRLLHLLVLAVLLAGCSTRTREPATISVEEALTVLRRAETHARAGDVEGLCSLSIQSRETCERQLLAAGGFGAVPSEPPTVVRNYLVPDTKLETGGIGHGGRVLVLEGKNNQGQPYHMEFVVFDKGNNQLVALTAPYWFNSTFTQVDRDGGGTTNQSPSP